MTPEMWGGVITVVAFALVALAAVVRLPAPVPVPWLAGQLMDCKPAPRAISLDDENACPCSALRLGKYANDRPDTDKQCTRRARFRVDGRLYCLRHAEIAALNILLKETDHAD